MNRKIIFTRFIYIAVNIVIVFGLLCPYLIAKEADIWIIVGILIVLVNSIHLILLFMNLYKHF